MKDRLPIGDPIGDHSIETWSRTLPDAEYHDMWETMDDDGHNRPNYIKSYVQYMHSQYLNGLESEERVMEILRGADLDQYLI